MIKILWFSNCVLSNIENKLSGSWLYSMSKLLIESGKVQLINICIDRSNNNSKNITKEKCNDKFTEYRLPNWKLSKEGYPPSQNINLIKEICIKENCDIIHIWGVENYFCNLLPKLNLSTPLLLEIQGLHGPCADVFYGDLSFKETIACLGLREWLFPFIKSIYASKKMMRKAAEKDKEALIKYKYISTQSQWVRDHLRFTEARLFKTGMSLRHAFWTSQKWQRPLNNEKFFYCSAAGPAPYKSIQTAIRALSIVKKKYPDAKLYIIGDFIKRDWKHQPGYLSFIYNLITKLDLSENIIFTGSLTAEQIINIIRKCIAMIQTSYVESYSLALAEAQSIGIPSIISYAGAMPELAEDKISGLFFSPGDYHSCAGRMIDCIENTELTQKISENSIKLAYQRNNNESVLTIQLNIYESIKNNEMILH